MTNPTKTCEKDHDAPRSAPAPRPALCVRTALRAGVGTLPDIPIFRAPR
jgi:hypothetical protein